MAHNRSEAVDPMVTLLAQFVAPPVQNGPVRLPERAPIERRPQPTDGGTPALELPPAGFPGQPGPTAPGPGSGPAQPAAPPPPLWLQLMSL